MNDFSSKSFKKEVKYTVDITIHSLIRSCFVDGKLGSFFVSRSEYENALLKDPFPFNFIEKLTKYHLYSPDLIQEIMKNGMSDKIYNLLTPPKFEFNSLIKKDEVADLESKLLRFSSSNHLFYSLDSKFPTSRAYRQYYIGGICNDRYDLKNAYSVLQNLEKAGLVWDIKQIKIPYYNATRNRSEAIEFTWRLTQEDYEKRIKIIQLSNSEFWSVRLKEIVPFGHEVPKSLDPLGLKEALYSKSKMIELDKYNEEDDE